LTGFAQFQKEPSQNARLFLFVLHHICILGNAQTKAVIPSRFYEEFAFRFFVMRQASQQQVPRKSDSE
jgi:hypothetical protein